MYEEVSSSSSRTSIGRANASRFSASDVLPHFLVHLAGHHQEEHAVVGDEGVEGVAEGRGLVVLDEEVAVPGEGVADDGDSDEEPEADGEGKAEENDGQDGAGGVGA